MNKHLALFFLVFCATFLYGFGEQPRNPALRVTPVYPAYLANLTDQNTNTAATYNFIILDLGADQYLQSLELYQSEIPTKIQTSSDGIGYDTVPTESLTTVNPVTYDLDGFNGRFVKIANPVTTNCAEIKIYAAPDFRLTYVSINAIPATQSCTLYVKTHGKGYMQALYGLNYDFIYNKILLGICSIMSMTDTETIHLTDLQPETTYRYQFKFRDLHGNTIESNYFTFTTLPAAK